ncbi:MAG: hypothetical protein AAF434_12510 [Pseudomonadota bacterium]
MKDSSISTNEQSLTDRLRLPVFGILLLSVWAVISLTNFVGDYRQLLYQSTRESGFYEWLTVLAGLTITAIAISRIRASFKSDVKDLLPVPILWIFAIIGVLGSLEEISWGQHIFGFESQGVFKEHNLQQETNLHNFVSQEYVNLLMQGFVYLVFIALPILSYLNIIAIMNKIPQGLQRLRPSLPTVGIFLTSCCFQDYFRAETYLDTTLVIFLTVVYLIAAVRVAWTSEQKLISLSVLISLVLAMVCDPVFEYNNMQYEIRELFILVGFIFWFLETGESSRQSIA